MEIKTYKNLALAFWLTVGFVLLAAYITIPNPSGKVENVVIRSCFAIFDTLSAYLLSLFILKRIIPFYSKKKNVMKSAALFLGAVTLVIAIRFSVSYYFMQRHFSDRIWADNFLWARIVLSNLIYDNFMLLILLPLANSGIRFLVEWYSSQAKIQRLQNEKVRAELEFLKAQVNPHFLFNTLNAVYFTIDEHNKDGREILMSFSQMLRYQLYECDDDEVSVEKELAYIERFVEIERVRRDTRYQISFQNNVQSSFDIAPMLLLPFVENAFKHVSNFIDKPNIITIEAWEDRNSFFFTVTNTKKNDATSPTHKDGIGLKNVRRRLELVYPQKHHLQIEEATDLYSTKLQIIFS